MLVKLAFVMQRLKNMFKKFLSWSTKMGGEFLDFMRGDTAVMRGDIELMGVPPVSPPGKTLVTAHPFLLLRVCLSRYRIPPAMYVDTSLLTLPHAVYSPTTTFNLYRVRIIRISDTCTFVCCSPMISAKLYMGNNITASLWDPIFSRTTLATNEQFYV